MFSTHTRQLYPAGVKMSPVFSCLHELHIPRQFFNTSKRVTVVSAIRCRSCTSTTDARALWSRQTMACRDDEQARTVKTPAKHWSFVSSSILSLRGSLCTKVASDVWINRRRFEETYSPSSWHNHCRLDTTRSRLSSHTERCW